MDSKTTSSEEGGVDGPDWRAALDAERSRLCGLVLAERDRLAAPVVVVAPDWQRDKNGYIKRNGERLGRVYGNPFFKNPSVHCACFATTHVRCAKWVVLSTVSSARVLEDWVADQDRHPDSASHLAALDALFDKK